MCNIMVMFLSSVWLYTTQNLEIVTEDGAPSGKKDFLVWDPAPIDPLEPSQGRQSPTHEAVTLMCYLMKRGIRTILSVHPLFQKKMFYESVWAYFVRFCKVTILASYWLVSPLITFVVEKNMWTGKVSRRSQGHAWINILIGNEGHQDAPELGGTNWCSWQSDGISWR